MSTETTVKLDKLRRLGFRSPEELATALKSHAIRFSLSELPALTKYLAFRLGRHSGFVPLPDWLGAVFSSMAQARSPGIICDPWAGTGFLVAIVADANKAKRVLAFTSTHSEAALGKELVDHAEWKVGGRLDLLATVSDIDLAVSILPWGVRAEQPLTLKTSVGRNVVLEDELGSQILVATAMHLSAEGRGFFVVSPSFFRSKGSALQHFETLGLGLEAALLLPSGTFSPLTNIPSYLVVVRKQPTSKMFVAGLSNDSNTNLQILANLTNGEVGGPLELGRFVDPVSFTGLHAIRLRERFHEAEGRFAAPAVALGSLMEGITLGRGEDFHFPAQENAIFVPLIGISDVVTSPDELTLKPHNYAQLAVDPVRSEAGFVARFLNSEFGKAIREAGKSGATIPKLNKQGLMDLRVFVPDLQTQKAILEVEARITAEQNTLLGLQNDLTELRRDLWANPRAASTIEGRLSARSTRLGRGLKEYAIAGLEHWFETLPFPLASILRAWQATASQDFKTKHEHLLHFFEATAEFVSAIFLSAFSSNPALFEPHKLKLSESMEKHRLSFQRATFGTWKTVVEYLGKQTRQLLSSDNDASQLCADIFCDSSKTLPECLSRVELANILSATNKMRNDWSGHGGVVGQDVAKLRNEQLLAEVQKLREIMGNIWVDTQLIYPLHIRPRRSVFENEVAILTGSNSEFLKETRSMATWLDVEHLYLLKRDSPRALRLLPLVQVGASPTSAKNACYFYSRLEKDSLRFVSYHFVDQPERKEPIDSELSSSVTFLWADQ